MTLNSTCQSPAAAAKGLAACARIAGGYTLGYVGNLFVMFGALAQLVGVCSWCGVKREDHANTNVLCAGCNIHWIAGVITMIWGLYWFAAFPLFMLVWPLFLPCFIAPCVGILGVSTGTVHQGYYYLTHTTPFLCVLDSAFFHLPLEDLCWPDAGRYG